MNFPIKKIAVLIPRGLLLLFFEEPEDEVQRRGNYALAVVTNLVENAHWVSLARARLSVNEVATVITIEHMENKGECTCLEKLGLWGSLPKHLRVLEVPWGPFLVIVQGHPAGRGYLHAIP